MSGDMWPEVPAPTAQVRDLATKDSFQAYLIDHPDERFWQALRNWSNHAYILVAEHLDLDSDDFENPKDTFYWEGMK